MEEFLLHFWVVLGFFLDSSLSQELSIKHHSWLEPNSANVSPGLSLQGLRVDDSFMESIYPGEFPAAGETHVLGEPKFLPTDGLELMNCQQHPGESLE